MADEKKYLDFEGLSDYDTKIKDLMKNTIVVDEAGAETKSRSKLKVNADGSVTLVI